MKRANAAAVITLIGFAGLLLFESRKLSFGALRLPHTGFFPKILLGLLLLLSLICLVPVLRGQAPDTRAEKIPAEGWLLIGATLVTLVGFALVLEWLGFLLSTFFLMVLLLRAVEAPPWPRVTLVALVTTGASYVIFAWLLGVPLPAGLLGF
jgi:putative tricarboxylic transport membrane protein